MVGMATRGVVYAVFLLPVIFSIVFGTAVMADILQKPGRELNMWNFGSGADSHGSKPIKIIGMEKQYSVSEPVSLEVRITDPGFSCGDLYITIYTSDEEAVTQSGFFDQCYEPDGPALPIDSEFSRLIDTPGRYTVVVEMTDQDQRNVITSKEFTVK